MENLLLLPQTANTIYLNSFNAYNSQVLPIYDYYISKELNSVIILSEATNRNKELGYNFALYEYKSGSVIAHLDNYRIQTGNYKRYLSNQINDMFSSWTLEVIKTPLIENWECINTTDCINKTFIISKTKLPRIDNEIKYILKENNFRMSNKNPKFDNIEQIEFLVSTGTQYANITYNDGKVRKLKASKVMDIVFPSIDKKGIEIKVKDLQAFAEKNILTIQLENDVYSVYREDLRRSIGSCMQGEPYAEMYDKLESCLGVVTLRNNENELVGRAILWKIEINGETVEFIDKCYILKESYKPQFEQFVKNNGYYYGVSFYSAEDKRTFISPTGTVLTDVKVHVNATIEIMQNLEDLPYMDRFTGYSESKESLTNTTNYDHCLDSTSGGNPLNNDNKVYSEFHSEYIDEDDAVYSEYYDSYIYGDEAFYCEYEDTYAYCDDVTTTPDGRHWITANCS